jgi:hypothetical protein
MLQTRAYQQLMVKPRWKPGQSGNPSGRPKIVREIRALCQKRGREIVDRLFEIANDK